nr:hypothetical protein BaRGS_023520 [Batillaria attramentaria]
MMWLVSMSRSDKKDSEETAKREIQFFFPEFDVSKWYQETEPLFRSGQVRFDEEKVEHVPVLQNGTAAFVRL